MNKLKTKKNLFILIIILLLALFLRTFNLSSAPPRLTHDEMSIGYNAYSIIKTAKDEWGRFLPLDFEAFGDHKLPGYIYVLAPFLKIFTLDVITLKIPSVIAGVMIVLAAYLITSRITKNKLMSLLTAFLLAVNPWSIHISRMALESNLALAFFSWGIYFLLSTFSANKKNKKYFNFLPIFAGILFGLTLYFYVAYRLIVVLFLAVVFLLTIKNKANIKKLLILFISFLIISLPLATQFLGKSGTARFAQVSIFSDEGASATILEQQNFCFLKQPKVLPKICRLIFNKPFFYTETFTKNYLSFLFPTFLFIEGDQLEYLNNPNFGEFYMFLAPFYLVGIYSWFKKKDLLSNFIKAGFFIAPVPSSLVGDPQIVRGSALMIFVAIFTAQGIISVYNLFSKNIHKFVFAGVMLILFSISISRFFISYNYIYSGKYESSFYHLPNEVILFLQSKEKSYDIIYIDKIYPDAHIMVAFYNKFIPSRYQKNIVRPDNPDDFGFSHPTKINQYEFGDNVINSFLCDESRSNALYVTNNLKQAPQWVFKDFSNVHIQAEVYDIKLMRELHIKAGTLEGVCP